MPPTMSSTNCDYSCDAVHSCFFLGGEEEDFYPPPQSQLLPGPSEDIWKKFELTHTPPSSISRTCPSPPTSPTSTNHLEMVPDMFEEECNPSAAFLQSYIIQDCMWSSSTYAVASKLEKMVSERLAALQARRHSNADHNADQTENRPVGMSRIGTLYHQDLNTEVLDCISPTAVLPSTTLCRKRNNESAFQVEVESDWCLDSPERSSSDSETEEELEEDDENEEIDIMTVDSEETSRRSSPLSPLLLKRSQISMYQHNYAAKHPSPSTPCPDVKRLNANSAFRVQSPLSDTDERDKRKSHNVLERQRRNELKMSIMALRDEVPSVSNNNRASKVVILKKATEFISEIKEDERMLLVTKAELKRRNRDLKRRLEQLRTLQ